MVMAIKNPVIIMALYDIGRDEWDSFNLSYNTYLHWMKNTLSLDANIVIFTEDKFINQITSYRKEFDADLTKTTIINRKLEDLECYKLYNDKLEKLMNSETFKNKICVEVPEMNKPLYNIIMFNKLFFLQEVKNKKYYNNDLLIWADAGGLRESIQNYKNVSWPSLKKINQLDNNKATFFSHKKNIIIDDFEYHSLSQIRNIQGTCFFVPSHLIDELTTKFCNTIDISINSGYIGSDEKIFDITYVKDNTQHNLIKCDWRTYFNIFKDDGSDLFDPESTSKKIFVNIGSYEGRSTLQKIEDLNIDENWEIHNFEANPLINSKKYFNNLPYNIITHQKAAWIRDGKTILNLYGDNGTGQGTLLEETNYGKNYNDYYESKIIPCIDINKFLESFNNKEIYLYIDAEYSEYYLLPYILKNNNIDNIKHIFIEWHGTDDFCQNTKNNIINKLNIHKIKYTEI